MVQLARPAPAPTLVRISLIKRMAFSHNIDILTKQKSRQGFFKPKDQ